MEFDTIEEKQRHQTQNSFITLDEANDSKGITLIID